MSPEAILLMKETIFADSMIILFLPLKHIA